MLKLIKNNKKKAGKRLKIQLANLSDVGKIRTANEDYYGYFEIKDLKIFIVSDGMGGHKGGSIASQIAVNAIKDYFEQNSQNIKDISEAINEALIQADLKIKQKADEDIELREMGTTAVVVVIKDNFAYMAHIGDSRIYLIRDGEIKKLTKDHSLVQKMLDDGLITEELAKTHPRRNIITRALGYGGSSDAELHPSLTLLENDILILCTDGLTEHLKDNEIKEIALSNNADTAVHKLIDLANERGGKDNITVQLIKVSTEEKNLYEKKKKKIFYSVLLVIIVLTILVGMFFVIRHTGIFQKGIETKEKQNLKDITKVKAKQPIIKDESTINSVSKHDTTKIVTTDSVLKKNTK